jgi:hypothetical protein
MKASHLLLWKVAAVGAGLGMVVGSGLMLLAGPRHLPRAWLVVLATIVVLILLELGLTLVSVASGKDVRLWRKGTPQLRVGLRLALLGRLITRTDRERLLHSFVRANNGLQRASRDGKLRATADRRGKVLLLAPTCLQAEGCGREITKDPSLCERCGNCPVKDLVELAVERGLELHFVGGGTLARALLEGREPDAVVAVACERELTEGILFSRAIPVLAIPNTRPRGPCKETQVDIAEVREAVESLLA